MNIKNVIKRCGVVFIVGPVFILGFSLNVLMWLTVIVWGPIYYIITGNDPGIIEESPLDTSWKFSDWYFKHFGPNE